MKTEKEIKETKGKGKAKVDHIGIQYSNL